MPNQTAQLTVGPLEERHLPEATRIFRSALGTLLGVPNPESFWSDRDYVTGRWRAPNVAAINASFSAAALPPSCPLPARNRRTAETDCRAHGRNRPPA